MGEVSDSPIYAFKGGDQEVNQRATKIGDWCCGFAGLVFGSVVFKLIGAYLLLICLIVGLTIGIWFEILDLAVFQDLGVF